MNSGKTCRTCLRLRAFLTCGGFLVVMIGLRPDSAVRIAGHMPSSMVFAAAMMALGVCVFVVRLISDETSPMFVPRDSGSGHRGGHGAGHRAGAGMHGAQLARAERGLER